MQALFKLFFLISILNKGPQDVPYSRFLFISLLIVLYVTDLLLAQIPYADRSDEVSSLQIALFLMLATIVIYGVTYLLIRAHGYANRAEIIS